MVILRCLRTVSLLQKRKGDSMSSNISNGNGDSQSRKSSFSREKQFGNSQSKEAVYTRDKQLDDFYDRGSFKEFDERRAGYQKAEEENAKLSAKFVQPAAPVINYNVGGGGGGYRDYQEEKEAHIKKELTEAKKLETERQIVLSRAKLEQETEEDNEFENRKNKRKGATEKNKWDTSFIPGYFSSIRTEMEQEIYDEAKRKANLGEQDRKNKALFLQAERKGEMAGVVDAHTHALSRLKAGAKVLAKNVKKDFVTPVVNGALDVVENPKNKRMVKNAIGAAQGVTKEIERDMLAYAKAKVIMNGTAEFNEEQVLDKDGNVKGFKRVFKQNGNRPPFAR